MEYSTQAAQQQLKINPRLGIKKKTWRPEGEEGGRREEERTPNSLSIFSLSLCSSSSPVSYLRIKLWCGLEHE